METDAYGGFIAIDVEAISCLFRVGVIGGTQYADIADDVLTMPPKYFRHSLECTKRAVEYFRSRGVSIERPRRSRGVAATSAELRAAMVLCPTHRMLWVFGPERKRDDAA